MINMEKLNWHVWSDHLFMHFGPAASWWEILCACMNPLCSEYNQYSGGRVFQLQFNYRHSHQIHRWLWFNYSSIFRVSLGLTTHGNKAYLQRFWPFKAWQNLTQNSKTTSRHIQVLTHSTLPSHSADWALKLSAQDPLTSFSTHQKPKMSLETC